jgi:hypothetical protein
MHSSMCYKVLYIHGVSCATAVQVHLLTVLLLLRVQATLCSVLHVD